LSDDASVKTIEIWADTRVRVSCRGESCRATVEWAEVVKSGLLMCFDTPVVALRTRHDEATPRLIEVVDRSTNHWASCPDATTLETRVTLAQLQRALEALLETMRTIDRYLGDALK